MINKDIETMCPCKKKFKSSPQIECKQCAQWWHTRCVALKGLDEQALEMLTNWHCPLCYVLPPAVPLGKLEAFIKKETVKIEDQLKSVKSAVSAEKLKSVMSEVVKNQLNEQVDTVTEAVSASNENTRRYIADTIRQNSDKVVTQVVQTSKEQMDNDSVAREQRKCKLIIRDVSESDAQDIKERVEHDKDFVLRILDIREDQLVNANRAGPPLGSLRDDTRLTRPLIITVATPELASYLHNYGRGCRVKARNGDIFWVNPDLIKADRLANMRARKLAQSRRQGRIIVTDEEPESPTRHTPTRRTPTPPVHANRVPVLRRPRRDSIISVSTVSSEDADTNRRSPRSVRNHSRRSQRSGSVRSLRSQESVTRGEFLRQAI